jgi:hypothetical protein
MTKEMKMKKGTSAVVALIFLMGCGLEDTQNSAIHDRSGVMDTAHTRVTQRLSDSEDTQELSPTVEGPHTILATTPTKGSVGSNVAVNSSGWIFAVLRRNPSTPADDLVLSASSTGQIWSTSSLGVGEADDATIAIDRSDGIHVVYTQDGTVYYLANLGSTGFGPPIALSATVSSATAESPQISVDQLGRVHVAWHVETPNGCRLVKYRGQPVPGAGWLPVQTLSDPDKRSAFPRFEASHAVDRIAIAWKVDTGLEPSETNTWDLGYAVSEDGGGIWTRYQYDTSFRETDPHVLVDPRGALHMAYMVQVTGGFEVHYIRSSDGENWTEAIRVDHDFGRFPQLALDAVRDRLWIVHKDDRDKNASDHRADIGARPLTWNPADDSWIMGDVELLSDHGAENVKQFGSSLRPDGSLHVVYDLEHATLRPSITLHARLPPSPFTPIPVMFSIHMEAQTARECPPSSTVGSESVEPDCADESEWLDNMGHLDSLIDALDDAGLKGTFMHQIQWLLRLENSPMGRALIEKMIDNGHEIALHHHGWDHADPDGYSDYEFAAGGVDYLGDMDTYLLLVQGWQKRWSYELMTMDGTGLEVHGDERPEWIYRTGSDGHNNDAFELMYDPVADECGFASGSGKPAWKVVALPNRATAMDDHTLLGYTYFGKGSANSVDCLSLYTAQILARTRAVQVAGPDAGEGINMVLHPVSDYGSTHLRPVYDQFFQDIANQGGEGMTVRHFMCDRAGVCE